MPSLSDISVLFSIHGDRSGLEVVVLDLNGRSIYFGPKWSFYLVLMDVRHTLFNYEYLIKVLYTFIYF